MGDEVWYAAIVGVIILSGLIIFFIFYLVGGRRTKNNDAWKQAATELGFNFTPTGTLGKYTMSGMMADGLKQLSCTVWAHTEQHGQSSITYMNYDVSFSQPLNLGLVVKREGAILGKTQSCLVNKIFTLIIMPLIVHSPSKEMMNIR